MDLTTLTSLSLEDLCRFKLSLLSERDFLMEDCTDPHWTDTPAAHDERLARIEKIAELLLLVGKAMHDVQTFNFIYPGDPRWCRID